MAQWKEVPRSLKNKNELMQHFQATDATGCRIWCLDVRPDVAGVKHVSKLMYAAEVDEHTHVAWAFVAQRLYDMPLLVNCLRPFCLPDVNKGKSAVTVSRQSLLSLQKKIDAYNEQAAIHFFGDKTKAWQFAQKQCNPTGSASAHSGHTWLTDLLQDKGELQAFKKFCRHAANLIFRNHDQHSALHQPPSMKEMMDCHGDNALSHTGSYYQHAMCRVALHYVSTRMHHGDRAVHPSCELTDDLWRCCMKYDGGARKGATYFGLSEFEAAQEFTLSMRKIKPNYCFCDLACWLCLAHAIAVKDDEEPPAKKRRKN